MLAMMQSGCGSTEAGVVLTYLNLPHSHTFQKMTFRRVQASIRPAIVELSERSMEEARHFEVSATVGESKYKLWKQKS